MKTTTKLEDLTAIDQLEDFLSGTQPIAFSILSDKDTCYRRIQKNLDKCRCLKLPCQEKGVMVGCL